MEKKHRFRYHLKLIEIKSVVIGCFIIYMFWSLRELHTNRHTCYVPTNPERKRMLEKMLDQFDKDLTTQDDVFKDVLTVGRVI